jgi:hypothetical protein
MSFTIGNLTEEEKEFLNYKGEFSKEHIVKHLENGLDFDNAVITEAQESLTSYHNWVQNNIKDEDKHKLNEFDNIPLTYHGTDLNEFEKDIFNRLPNIGKWQWSNYSRIWRALEEADECLMEFVYHEANYLCQGPQAAPDNNT